MTKISQLSDIGAGLAAGDEFIIRDVSDATTPNKKVTASGFMNYVISQSTSGNFSTISAGTGPLSRVQTTFSGATGTITFGTASAGSLVERLRITSAGFVGIGTSAPLANLDCRGSILTTNGTTRWGLIGTDTDGAYLATAGINHPWIFKIGNGSTDVERMRLTSGGLGIGTNAPSSLLHLVSSGQPTITIADDGSRTLQVKAPDSGVNPGFVGTTTNHDLLLQAGISAAGLNAMRFNTAGSERARIDSSGRLLVGTSSQSGGALLQVNGDRVRIATAKTPASATDTGTTGEVCWDANYVYVCTGTNTWKRAALSTW